MFEIRGPLDYTEMLFVDQQMVEYPLGFEQEIENWPTNNFSPYVILGNRIVFNGDTLDLKKRPNELILNDFTFRKATFELGEPFEYLDLQISYGGELSFAFTIDSTGKYDLYHSSLAKDLKGKLPHEEINYLKKLSRRIQLDDLNRFYNVTRTHSRTYELQIYLNGQMYQVQTEGVREAFPFGLKAFIRNAIIAIEKQIYRQRSGLGHQTTSSRVYTREKKLGEAQTFSEAV